MKTALVTLLLITVCALANGANIIGYWGCNPGGHASTTSQLQNAINRGYNVIVFAFYDVDANGGLNQDPGAVTPPVKSSLGGRNFTYLVSLFGGQNGAAPTLSMSSDAWAQNMYNNFVKLHQAIGFDGIDIDLENAWGGTPNDVICGLRKFFQLMHNARYIISMAPQTTALTPEVSVYQPGSWNSYAPLADTGIIDYVDIVAVQLYNNAVPSNSPSSYASALINGFQVGSCPKCSSTSVSGMVKIPPKKIAFGYPAGPGAAPSGCPGLPGGCPYGSALASLYGNSVLAGTGGVMTWSVEWDEASNWQFVSSATKINFH
jgi:chitinase